MKSWIARLLFVLVMVLAPSQVFGDLLLVEWSNGLLWEVSATTASKNLIGSTGLTDVGALELSPTGTLYAVTFSNPVSSLYVINPQTGAASQPINLNLPFPIEGSLVFSPSGVGYLVGNSPVLGTSELLQLNVTNGQLQTVGSLGNREFNGLMWRNDGMLVGMDWQTNSLVEVNPNTAATQIIATLPFPIGVTGGIAGNVNGRWGWIASGRPALGASGSDSLYSFNPFTGQTTLIGPLNLSQFGAGGLAIKIPEPSSFALLSCLTLGFAISNRGHSARFVI